MNVREMTPGWPATLPVQGTAFLGRETEISEIGAFLSDPARRLLTLVGPGGTGKTRLALEAAAACQNLFPDGVYFISLEPARSADFFLHSLADALQLSLNNPVDPALQIHAYLQHKNLLLLLDNFETLLDEAEVVSRLIQSTAQVKLLVTSRGALNLVEEHLYPVSGMPYPVGVEPEQDLERYAAVRLFAVCARRYRPDFDLETEQEGMVRICRLVEGMPLALELAAAWTRLMSCAEIAEEIQRSISFLSTNLRNIPERHRSIQAVFDRSWDMLSEPERQVFMRLSVFQGGFQREAAIFISGASLAVLSVLVDKSLLQRAAPSVVPGGPRDRYHVHELLRQAAAERLAETPEELYKLCYAHCRFYMDRLKRLEGRFHRGEQTEALAEVQADYENILSAWLFACEQGLGSEIARGSLMLNYYCQCNSRFVEAVELFERAKRGLEDQPLTPDNKLALALSLNELAWFSIRLGRYETAEESARRGTILQSEFADGPPPGIGTDSLLPLAVVTQVRGDYAEVRRLAGQAREAAAERKDGFNEALANYVLASAHLSRGQFEHGREHAQIAYQQAKRMKNRWFMAYCLVVWGSAARAMADYREAAALFDSAYAIREMFNDPEGMAVALNHQGNIALLREEYEEAARLFQQAHGIYERIYDRGGLATSLDGLCQAAIAEGALRRARRLAVDALLTVMEIGFNALALDVLTTSANLFLAMGSIQRGCELLAYVAGHPAAGYETHQRAARLLEEQRQPGNERLLYPADLNRLSGQPLNVVIQAVVQDLSEQLVADLPGEAAEREPAAGKQVISVTGHTADGLVEQLSAREIEVLSAMARGLSNQAIAAELILSTGTVKWYTSQIYGKLGVNSRTQAIARARELKLLV